MAVVDFGQALGLQRENRHLQVLLDETRRALASVVAEQDRLLGRIAELAEMLATVEAERDRAHRALGTVVPHRVE